MSGKMCAFKECFNSKRKNPNLTFFCFPRSSNQQTACRIKCWIKNSGLPEDLPSEYYRRQLVCQLHFEDWCFNNPLHKKLTYNAIPTICAQSAADCDENSLKLKNPDDLKGFTFAESGIQNLAESVRSSNQCTNNEGYEASMGSPKNIKRQLHISACDNVFNTLNECINYSTNSLLNYKTYSRVKTHVNEEQNGMHNENSAEQVDFINEKYSSKCLELQTDRRKILEKKKADIETRNEFYKNDSTTSGSKKIKQKSEFKYSEGSQILPITSSHLARKDIQCEQSNMFCNIPARGIAKSDDNEIIDIIDLTCTDGIENSSNSELMFKNMKALSNIKPKPNTETEIDYIKKQLKFFKKRCMVKSRIIKKLKDKVSHCHNLHRQVDYRKVTHIRKVLAKMQLKKAYLWNSDEKELSLNLYRKFPITLKYMRDKLGLRFPKETRLNKWIEDESNLEYK